jgi:hypothetical protein
MREVTDRLEGYKIKDGLCVLYRSPPIAPMAKLVSCDGLKAFLNVVKA